MISIQVMSSNGGACRYRRLLQVPVSLYMTTWTRLAQEAYPFNGVAIIIRREP